MIRVHIRAPVIGVKGGMDESCFGKVRRTTAKGKGEGRGAN